MSDRIPLGPGDYGYVRRTRRPKPKHPFKFRVGQRVIKPEGYPFPGIVVVRYLTLKDKNERYVVDFTDADGQPTGLQHIFNAFQLEAHPTGADWT